VPPYREDDVCEPRRQLNLRIFLKQVGRFSQDRGSIPRMSQIPGRLRSQRYFYRTVDVARFCVLAHADCVVRIGRVG
jgi:hypothetical protein